MITNKSANHDKSSNNFLTCPCCGLGCDDLFLMENGEVETHGCAIASRYYQTPSAESQPHLLNQSEIAFDAAVAMAATKICAAKQPVFIGPGLDMAGASALLALADLVKATVDSRSKILPINMPVMQASGWIAATFSEVANRADLVVIVGGDPSIDFPRMMERLVENKKALYRQSPPKVIRIGEASISDHPQVEIIATAQPQILSQIAALTALVKGELFHHENKIPSRLLELAEQMRAAKYCVIAWDAATLAPDRARAQLVVDLLTELIRSLNLHSRAIALPCSGADNTTGFAATMTWQTGFPMWLNYSPTGLESDPHRDNGIRLATSEDADLVLWLATINTVYPPPLKGELIAIVGDGFDASQCAASSSLIIRAGQVGRDHSGEVGRGDSIVLLPVPTAFSQASTRKSAATIIAAITAKIQTLQRQNLGAA